MEIISGIFQAAVVEKKNDFIGKTKEKIWRSSCRMNFESLFSIWVCLKIGYIPNEIAI